MAARRLISTVFLTFLGASSAQTQDAVSPSASDSNSMLLHRPITGVSASANETIPLTVPKGLAVQIVLDKEVRIQKVGQSVHGRVTEPMYAFDKLVVPQGTEVTGQITELGGISVGERILDALNADFTPPRKVQIEFDNLELPDGRHIPLHTTVTPGSGQVIQFVSASDREKNKSAKGAASQRADQVKEEAKRQWDNAMQQVREPGKIRKIRRYSIAQLPVHPQYIDAGTVYFAELEQPLDFGTEPLTPEITGSINTPPPPDSSVHVRLMTALSSATSHKGDDVEAVLSQPLFNGNGLVFPQGSQLKGSVVQVRPARRLSRNGQLRMVFHDLVLPQGIEQEVEASLAGAQAGKGQDVKLDSEGGAEANSPKSRYLTTGIAVALAFASAHGDPDARNGDVSGNTNNRVAGGAGGFKLIGIVMGVLIHSQPLGAAMGAYGASMSVYSHFVARGRDVVFPRNTAMEIAIGARPFTPSPKLPKPADASTTRQ